MDRRCIKPPSQQGEHRNIDEKKHRSTAASAVHICRFVLILQSVYVRSVKHPRTLRCQCHRFYSVADSTKYHLEGSTALSAEICDKPRSTTIIPWMVRIRTLHLMYIQYIYLTGGTHVYVTYPPVSMDRLNLEATHGEVTGHIISSAGTYMTDTD